MESYQKDVGNWFFKVLLFAISIALTTLGIVLAGYVTHGAEGVAVSLFRVLIVCIGAICSAAIAWSLYRNYFMKEYIKFPARSCMVSWGGKVLFDFPEGGEVEAESLANATSHLKAMHFNYDEVIPVAVGFVRNFVFLNPDSETIPRMAKIVKCSFDLEAQVITGNAQAISAAIADHNGIGERFVEATKAFFSEHELKIFQPLFEEGADPQQAHRRLVDEFFVPALLAMGLRLRRFVIKVEHIESEVRDFR